jgi:hypothetical protein
MALDNTTVELITLIGHTSDQYHRLRQALQNRHTTPGECANGEVVRVAVQLDDEGDPVWLYRPQSREPDHHDGWLADIPIELWEAWEVASHHIHKILAIALQATGRDNDGRLPQPCDQWEGTEYHGLQWWQVNYRSDGTGQTWPATDTTLLRSFTTKTEAEQQMAEIAGRELLITHQPATITSELDPARLYLDHHTHPPYATHCARCNWDQRAHNQGDLNPGSSNSSDTPIPD